MNFNELNYNFSLAMDEAYNAEKMGEVPVGAVIVDSSGKIISKAHNVKESNQDPCGHAEILAIKEAAIKLSSWRLTDCSLIVTLEPCPMCMGAIIHARLKNVYFGAYDLKGGALSVGINIHNNKSLNHKVNIFGGFKHLECSKQLSNFFKKRRKNYR